jgi:hypothetical protein
MGFYRLRANKEELLALDRCSLFLLAYFRSDITNEYGSAITVDAWIGRKSPLNSRANYWPKRGLLLGNSTRQNIVSVETRARETKTVLTETQGMTEGSLVYG